MRTATICPKVKAENIADIILKYLQKISKQSGLPFEMVDIASWNAAYDMLVKGEIDLLPAVYHSEQRAEEIFFSGQPMCSIYTTLNVSYE